MIDRDGHYSYSKTVTIRFDNTSSLSVFPNPAGGTINVELHLPAGQVLLQVIDASGHMVRSQSLESTGTNLSMAMDISGLANGWYFIRAGGETLSFVKQ